MAAADHALRPYVYVLLALLGLTAVTVAAATVHLVPPWSDVVALTIAVVKASLVVLFFMHVKGSTALVKVAAVAGFFWLLVFFALLLSDVLTRTIDGVTPL